jgi:hypothetical protein
MWTLPAWQSNGVCTNFDKHVSHLFHKGTEVNHENEVYVKKEYNIMYNFCFNESKCF